MDNFEFNSERHFTPQELVRIIATYFDENELIALCFELNINYEDLPGDTRYNRIISLVKYAERHNRFQELIDKVLDLRPFIGVDWSKFVDELSNRQDPHARPLRSLFEQLNERHGKLYKWKKMHSQLDDTINTFGQFEASVERGAASGDALEDIGPLHKSWHPVNNCLVKLFAWAERDMQHIAKPFKIHENGEKSGESWLIDLHEHYLTIQDHIRDNPLTILNPPRQNWRHIRVVSEQETQNATILWRQWWRSLRDHTRSFDSTLKLSMYLADDGLHIAAESLNTLSQEAFWRRR